MGDYFIGKDPLRIEEHWQTMYRRAFYRGRPGADEFTIAGIDQALWISKRYYHAPKLMRCWGES